MSGTQLSTGKETTDIRTILNSPSQKSTLQAFVNEMVNCKQAIAVQQEEMKALREQAVEQLNIKPKLLNALVAVYYNNNFDEKQEEIDQLEAAIIGLMQVDD